MTARSIPKTLAPVLEELELDQPRVVLLTDLESILDRLGAADGAISAPDVAYELQRRGWLGRLRTQGAWEFYPAARAGAIGSGDRFVELRAYRRRNPTWPGALAMESAASVLGLAQRLPEREVLALPLDHRPPAALSQWRLVRLELPEAGLTTVDDLPTWNVEGLLAGIAKRPSGYRDIAGLGQWLATATERIDPDRLVACVAGAPTAARQRAAYLVGVAGRPELVEVILPNAPLKPAWFGTRRPGGRFDTDTMVNDTELAPYLSGGEGA